LATSRSIAALVVQPSFPNGTGILGRLSLLDRAESGCLAESAASATSQKPTVLRLIVIDRGGQALREFVGA
jgi:hypothetical protein